MELAHLETFLAIAEEQGFSRAAVRLRRTQPAVSQTIRKLEEELGERLFERGTRDGTLTAAGEVLRDYAERLLRLRVEAASAVEELRSLERGRLLVAANEYTSHLLIPVLAAYRQVSPQINIVVQRSLASRIPEQVLERSVELGVLSFQPEQEGLLATAIYDDEVALVVDPQHPLASAPQVSVRDLGTQNFIGHAVASPLRREITALFARLKTPLHMGVQLPSLEAIKRFVALGAGVAILPALAVAQEVEQGMLVRVPVPEFDWKRRMWLIRRRHGTLSHAASAFLRSLQTLAEQRGAPHAFAEEPES
ncbi:LysR family transcriptional regulator [Acidipila sp. EB88]|uniref:LysR family transcriptional regulator n=1 Tax=Acidipila sp. EB88 TaxID=2305226 RepID=UPI000F5E0FE5|nr:LysR substrate-binding domain-containing protein [Acidipila sp. EB88]RRA48855.1 LysR family transcriptional regulator [Acidipila sp. EB88]